MDLGREADNVHSLARLKPMNQVGGKADTCGGLSTDTAFLFGNGAEGVVAVVWSPKQSFTAGVQPNGNVCLAELDRVEVTQGRQSRSGWNQAFLTQL